MGMRKPLFSSTDRGSDTIAGAAVAAASAAAPAPLGAGPFQVPVLADEVVSLLLLALSGPCSCPYPAFLLP